MRRYLSVGVAGVLVLAASFLPWFSSRWATSHNGVDGHDSNHASAWSASTGWTVAVILALLAAGLGLPRRTAWAGAALAIVAAGLAVWTWQRIPPLSGAGFGWTAYAGSEGGQVGDINRDHLVIYHGEGLELDVGWGLYAGLVAMALLVTVLAVEGRRGG